MLISIHDNSTSMDRIIKSDYWPTEYSSSGEELYRKAKNILLSIFNPDSYGLTIDYKNIKLDNNINCTKTNYPLYEFDYHLSINDNQSYDGTIEIDSDLDLVSIKNLKQNTIKVPNIYTAVASNNQLNGTFSDSTFMPHNQDQKLPAPDCEKDDSRYIELSPNSFDAEDGSIQIKDPELQIGIVSEDSGSFIIDATKQAKRDDFLKHIKVNRKKSKGENTDGSSEGH